MSHAAAIAHVAFMSPGDGWDKWLDYYRTSFLEVLHAACDPAGYLRFFGLGQVA